MLALGLRHNHFVPFPDSFSPSEDSCAGRWDRLPPALWKMQLLRQLSTVGIDRIDSARTIGGSGGGGSFSVDTAGNMTAATSFISYGSTEVHGTLQVDPVGSWNFFNRNPALVDQLPAIPLVQGPRQLL